MRAFKVTRTWGASVSVQAAPMSASHTSQRKATRTRQVRLSGRAIIPAVVLAAAGFGMIGGVVHHPAPAPVPTVVVHAAPSSSSAGHAAKMLKVPHKVPFARVLGRLAGSGGQGFGGGQDNGQDGGSR